MLCRAMFAAGRYQEVVMAEDAIEASGEDYKRLCGRSRNSLGAWGKVEAPTATWPSGSFRPRLGEHLKTGAEDARARICSPATTPIRALGRCLRELQPGRYPARQTRPRFYTRGLCCTVGFRESRTPSMPAQSVEAGFRTRVARRDPDLASLHGDPDLTGSTRERSLTAPVRPH